MRIPARHAHSTNFVSFTTNCVGMLREARKSPKGENELSETRMHGVEAWGKVWSNWILHFIPLVSVGLNSGQVLKGKPNILGRK